MPADLTLGSAFMSGVSEYEASQTRSRLYRANVQVANAQAQSEREAAAYNENMMRLKAQATEGRQVAQIGASNLQQAGTPSQVVASTAAINEMDILTARNNALRRAWGFSVQSASDAFQSDQAQRGAVERAFGSILSGGAKALDQYNSSGSFF